MRILAGRPGPGFRDRGARERSVIDALMRWRWTPVSCGDTPIPSESMIWVTYGR